MAKATHHTVELNGHSFHYLEWGRSDAPVLLFLHGFPEYSGAWTEVAERLADRFRCIAPDQRGFGRSWAPAEVEAYSLRELVGDMVALIDHLGGPVTVVGHDWGAAVAYGLAMFQPQHVSRLVIINGVHPAPFQRELAAGGEQTSASQYILYLRFEGSEEKLAANDFDGLLKLFSAKMDLGWMTPERQKLYKAEWSRPGRLRGMINWYRASPLKVAEPGVPLRDVPALSRDRLQVRCPHLLIWGDGDTALLPVCIEGLEEYAGDLTVRHVAGADHWICHQKPEAVAGLIRSFVEAHTE
ncbi:pimeloyl-ACP methyl ester carboxylesterase [Hoeflea halophila]|uniref:Pimeloyl-ACP methyl ester carboxylesterase n=1 Tax=Hoeflea halophila TaxID=714899 RepID=A0A286HMV7_9HYPH|nr:alpha/beta hydrolase [Hoeflea halophila]SOE09067.1 pimeloyl-ACP methyl ester carboxylesterase [Hoeflea halophila]